MSEPAKEGKKSRRTDTLFSPRDHTIDPVARGKGGPEPGRRQLIVFASRPMKRISDQRVPSRAEPDVFHETIVIRTKGVDVDKRKGNRPVSVTKE